MRVCNFTEFAALPEGTVYSYYEPCICSGLHRKGDTIFNSDGAPIDFFESSLIGSCYGGEPYVDDSEGRWGLFEYDQLFAVYEPEDIAKIIGMLSSKPSEPV